MIHFSQPAWAILGIPALLLLGGYLYLFYYRISTLSQMGIDPSMTIPRARDFEWARTFLLLFSFGFAVMALMRPLGGAHYVQGEAQKREDVLFALDASASMEVADTETGVSRFNRAREIIGDLSQRLRGSQVSLLSFTSEVTPLIPLTWDNFFFQLFLTKVQINEGGFPGTDLGILFDGLKEKEGVVILLTDGGDTAYGVDPKKRKEELTEKAKTLDFSLFVIGLGGDTPKKIPGFDAESKLEKSLLKDLAEASGGAFLLPSERVATELAEKISESLQAPKKIGQEEVLVYDEYFFYPLGLALFLLAAALLLPETRRGR